MTLKNLWDKTGSWLRTGKLAKLIAGQWNTHSSQSDRAVGLVTRIAGEVLAEEPPASETVEGVFATLAPEQRARLGDELSRRISASVSQRIGSNDGTRIAVATFLINMAGEPLSAEGDFTPWQ